MTDTESNESNDSMRDESPPLPQLIGNWGARLVELCEESISHPEGWVFFREDGTGYVEDDDAEADEDDDVEADEESYIELRDTAAEEMVLLYREAFLNDMKIVGVNAFIRRQDPEKGIERLANLVRLFDQHCRDYTGERLVESFSLKARVRRHEKLIALSSWLRQIGTPIAVDDVMPLMQKADEEKLNHEEIVQLLPQPSPSRLSQLDLRPPEPTQPQPRLSATPTGVIVDGALIHFDTAKTKTKTLEKLYDMFTHLIANKDYGTLGDFGLKTRHIENQPLQIQDLLESQPGAGTRIAKKWLN